MSARRELTLFIFSPQESQLQASMGINLAARKLLYIPNIYGLSTGLLIMGSSGCCRVILQNWEYYFHPSPLNFPANMINVVNFPQF